MYRIYEWHHPATFTEVAAVEDPVEAESIMRDIGWREPKRYFLLLAHERPVDGPHLALARDYTLT